MPEVITDIQQVTPAWLGERLRENGYLPHGTVVQIDELEAAQSSVSRVYYLGIRYAGGDGETAAPPRLFLKLPNPGLTRGDREVEFYRAIAPAMSEAYPAAELPFLRCYDAAYAEDSGRSHLLLEDASATHFALDGPLPLR